MAELAVLILCGRSPRHLHVANRLCRAARPLAIVHETGTHWTAAKIAKAIRPTNLWRKGWRWLRDRRRYVGGGEAKFFFGDAAPQLDRPDLVVEVPHVNDPRVVELARKLEPDVIAVFGTSLIRGPLLKMGRLGIVNLHGGLSPVSRRRLHVLGALQRRAGGDRLLVERSRAAHPPRPDPRRTAAPSRRPARRPVMFAAVPLTLPPIVLVKVLVPQKVLLSARSVEEAAPASEVR